MNRLLPIPGAGARRPKYMFLFINPTARNISSNADWKGPRYPFVGTKQIWRIFHKAGLFDDALMTRVESGWDVPLARDVLSFLKGKEFYLTNLVKTTGENADLPSRKVVASHLPSLEKEIKAVRPRSIVTFGLLPFHALSEQPIKLDDCYSYCRKNRKLQNFETGFGKITPIYFPVGRGNPKRAVEMLKLLL